MNHDPILDLSCTGHESFKRGFWKGLGAPYLLFGEFVHDPAAQCQFQQLPKRPRGSMAEDWKLVGEDIKAALVKRG